MSKNAEINKILDLCLDRVLRKGESVETCLRDYPNQARELESLLRMAIDMCPAGQYTPSPSAKATARMALHRAIQERKDKLSALASPWRSAQVFVSRMLSGQKWALAATTTALFVVLASSGVVAASSNSQPDHVLYPVKRTVERARLVMARDPDAKARLHADFADKRIEEMGVMAAKGDRRRTEDLRQDLELNLNSVRIVVLPDQSIVVAIPPGQAQVPPKGLRPEGRQGPKRDPKQLREMQRFLQSHAQKVDKHYQEFLREASEGGDEEDLREKMQSARQEYQELVEAFQRAYVAQTRESASPAP